MKKKKKHTKWWWIVGGIIVLLAGTGIMILTAEEPPVKKMEEVRNILSEAERVDAEIYCRKLYREARAQYDSAMISWKTENEKLIVFRKFERTIAYADAAKVKGKAAIQKSERVRQNTKEGLRDEIDKLRQDMRDFERIFAILPLSQNIKKKHSEGKLLLNGADIAFDKGEYAAGIQKSRNASVLIHEAYGDARKKLEQYFKQLPKWQKEREEAIEISRKKREYVVIIEKLPPRCEVYYNGKEKYSFPVEFGCNWIGDKKMEGDNATPEGFYKVSRKMQGGATRYYKALLLDYPNREDRNNFEKRKKEGSIPRNVRIGNLIEIHGTGGRGANWTNGCAALTNKDMDELYRKIDKGGVVLIIGASGSLEEALKKMK